MSGSICPYNKLNNDHGHAHFHVQTCKNKITLLHTDKNSTIITQQIQSNNSIGANKPSLQNFDDWWEQLTNQVRCQRKMLVDLGNRRIAYYLEMDEPRQQSK